jgi:phage tail-like protein
MASRVDPYAGYNFSVELDGMTRAGFRECSGLENSQNAGEYREGTDKNPSARKIPGLVTYSDITLSRGTARHLHHAARRRRQREDHLESVRLLAPAVDGPQL